MPTSEDQGSPSPLLDAKQSGALDRLAVENGATFAALMEQAGAGIADAAARRVASGGRIVVLCGPGNNGGDGYVAARLLGERGYQVEAGELGTPQPGTDAQAAARIWNGPTQPASTIGFEGAALIVDALFGTGFARTIDAASAALIERANASGVKILAVDMPSGVNADTGDVGASAIRAAHTVTFATAKPGHLLYPGRTRIGELTIADIGIPERLVAELGATLWRNAPQLWMPRWPQLDASSHKYHRGHALVLSGTDAHTGAARLAARAALRIGAGLVSIATPRAALAINAAQLTAIMLRPCDNAGELRTLLEDGRFNAVVLGPALGVGEFTESAVASVMDADRATVLDADALTSFSGQIDALRTLLPPGRRHDVVLTPHAGEFRRLFAGEGETNADAVALVDLPSKVERARAASRLTGAIVVLKGPDTVIAAPDGRAAINANGTPYLATAGSGDVLGGLVGGLMAQGMPGFEAACAAVWLHAEAGSRRGPGLIAEDLPESMPAVLQELHSTD